MDKIQNYKNILMIRLDKIGDVVLSTPAIKAVREAYPGSRITFMVRPYTREIVEGNPYLDEVLVYDKGGKEKGFIGNLRFALELCKRKFDLVLMLHPTNRTNILAFLAGIPVRVGYDRKWGSLLTKKIPHTKQFGLRHEIDYTLGVLKYLGIEPKDRMPYMPENQASKERVMGLFAKAGINDPDTVVAINPGASCPSRRWNRAKYAKVADGLVERYGARIVIIASGSDKGFGDEVSSAMKEKSVNLSGFTNISDLANVLRRSKLFISNDTGPVHVSCAVGTPVIAIFGRNDRGVSPARWGPCGKSDIVLHKDVGCDVCLAHNCRLGFKCLEAITVEEVLAAAAKILGR